MSQVVLPPPSAEPHISHPSVPKSRGMTASPRGEKPCPESNPLPNNETNRKLPPKASPLREKLSENRLFGTDFLTDVGDRRLWRRKKGALQSSAPKKFQSVPQGTHSSAQRISHCTAIFHCASNFTRRQADLIKNAETAFSQIPASFISSGTLASQPRAMMCRPWQ